MSKNEARQPEAGEFAKAFEEWFASEYPLPPTIERGPIGQDFKAGCRKAWLKACGRLDSQAEEHKNAILEAVAVSNKLQLEATAKIAELNNQVDFLAEENHRLNGIDAECEGYKEEIRQLEETIKAIWPFIEDDFPKGTGDNHGTCATDEYVKAARMIEKEAK